MFEFASGKLNVLEKRIFNALDQERMLKAPDYKMSFEVLYDTDLGEIATKTKNIEEIIERDLINLKKLFLEILEEKKIILFLFLKFDLSNIKLAFKKKYQKEINIRYIPWAMESSDRTEKWLSVLSGREKADMQKPDLNPLIKRLIILTNNRLKKNISSKAIEIAADKAYFEIKLALAAKIAPLLKEITEREKQRENINVLSEIIFNKARETSSGAEKVVSFFQRKLNACHNIRLILFAKLNNIKIAEIEDKLLLL